MVLIKIEIRTNIINPAYIAKLYFKVPKTHIKIQKLTSFVKKFIA